MDTGTMKKKKDQKKTLEKPIKPRKPIEPKEPKEKYTYQEYIRVYQEITDSTINLSSILDEMRQKCEENDCKFDVDEVNIVFDAIDDGWGVTGYDMTFTYPIQNITRENPNYDSKLKKYQKNLEKYKEKMASYDEAMIVYEQNLSKYLGQETEKQKKEEIAEAKKVLEKYGETLEKI